MSPTPSASSAAATPAVSARRDSAPRRIQERGLADHDGGVLDEAAVGEPVLGQHAHLGAELAQRAET
ncbi:MAG: hypothetical protein U1F43_05975 [Myxococcota bacterium]